MTQQNGTATTPGTKLPPSIVIGNFKVLHRPDGQFEETKARLAGLGFLLEETEHFLLARPAKTDRVILVHRFQSSEVDNNLVDYLMQELPGLMTSEQAFGHAMIGIVHSIKPHDPVDAWGIFTLNTLQRLREHMDEHTLQNPTSTIYRRLFELKVGASLLDVGCACAFWPVLVAERDLHDQSSIVGVDSRLDAIHLSQHMAVLTQHQELTFAQLDLLSPQFVDEVGTFDTVTAIHLLEHLPEAQLALAFQHLLQVTRHRLMVAVPYEAEATRAYGHENVFTREILEHWGQWCVEAFDGIGRFWCEDVAGGLLVIDRSMD
ncbi:MAG TPA: class I SAM-dependent methyltransferase [Ktedonobacteraceae bacterium]